MTALDTPFNPGQSRGQTPQVGRMGIQLTPNAPGLVPLPPVSQNGSQLRQMIDAIGLAGQLGRTASSIADNETRRREFKQRDHNRLYEAAAAVQARVAITEIQQEIDSGKLEVPKGVDVGDFAAELARDRLPDGTPEAYSNRYKSILIPEMAGRIASKQAADIEEARSESLKLLAEGVYSWAATPEDALDAVAEAKRIDPNLTDLEAKASVLLPSLQVAIEQGNATSFNVIAEALGQEFSTTVARARVQLESKVLQNQQQKSTDQMKQATQVVDSLIDSEYATDQMIREAIGGMDINSTQRATLNDRLVNRRASQLAAARSEQRQLIESIHDSVDTPMDLRARLDSFAEQLGLTQREIEQEVLVFARAEIELAANRGDLDRIDELAPALGEGAETQLILDEARSVAVNNIRQQRFDVIISGLQANEIDPAVVRQIATEDARKAIDNPDSPDVFSTAQRDQMLRVTKEKEQRDLSLERVGKVLSGDGRAVVTRQDDQAIDLALGSSEEGGFGLIDADNNITDPARLGASVAALNRVTANTRDVVMTNLMRGQPDQQVQAMQALSVIAQGRPGLLAEFAGDDLAAGAVIAEIRTMTDRGLIANQPGTAMQRLAPLMGELSETTLSPTLIDTRFKADGIDINKQVETVMDNAADLMPWRDPSILPFNEAVLVDPSDEAMQYVGNQFRQQYYYQVSQGRSKDEATEFAQRTAQELLVRNFDFVRFNGEMHIQRIDNGVNRLRDDYRWDDGYDKLVQNFAERNGIDVDDVFTLRPTTGAVAGNRGEAIQGWMLIDQNLDPITDDQGRVLLWEPPADLRDKTLQTRKLLEVKATEFGQQPARQRDTTFDGIDPATIQAIP